MPPHILLLIDSYVTNRDPRRGSKFRLQMKSYKERGFQVGLVAFMQRDYSLSDCLRRGGFVWEDEEFGAPIVRNCEFHALSSKVPYVRNMPIATRRLGPSSVRYYMERYGRPEIIHAHGSRWSGYAANLVFEAKRIPYVVTEHMSNYAQGKVKAEHLPLMRKTFAQASMRLPISDSTGKVLEDLFGDDFHPWTVVPNMVDDSLFPCEYKPEVPSGDLFTFFTVGRHDPIKGYDNLLKAFAGRFRGEKVRLRIGGGGGLSGELRDLAYTLDIVQQVQFLGPLTRERIAEELRQANAYVLSSHYETFGIPILEAHAFGVPVVATACGGPQQLVNKSNGILVEPENVEALAQGMAEMIGCHENFDRNAIRDQCLNSYAPSAILDQLEVVYNMALGKVRM